MIQFNLLPEVKMEYIKAQRLRSLVVSVSLLITAGSFALFLVLFGAGRLQQKHLGDLDRDITTQSKQLQSKPQIAKVLSVQNQLKSLTALHEAKPNVSQLFGYLNSLTPTQVSISNVSVDFTAYTINVTGATNTLSSVNQYVDTIKYAKYTSKDPAASQDTATAPAPAFSNVVLASFGLNSDSTSANDAATYNVTFSYDPKIFDNTQDVQLQIQTTNTTRASSNLDDLFKAKAGS